MASESENADSAAERLELALERIARLSEQCSTPVSIDGTSATPAEIASRLDAMIERLRAALNGKPER